VAVLFRPDHRVVLQTREAIAAHYETHYERIARYIAVRIGHTTDAEDLASDVFVRALRSADSYKPGGAPMEAWLIRIAHNIVVDYLRKKGRRPANQPLDEGLELPDSNNPTEPLEKKEEFKVLHEKMGQLSEAQRKVLALRFGAEMTSEQIAQVMGKNPGAIREMQSAAIKKLRSLMEEQA
jgi:RNA polymerase sigma-70 factor (ECF subfamily)